ncbi:MAG TPA: S46 family peptidase, partial [Clostridia bacterium]|nr:S46 family peptidase [Clostridia bacterium]
SGSFVSEEGLLISNHHVGADALQKLSTPEKNYLRDGFYARTPAEEIPCLDLELNVLQSIQDVTERVNAAIPPGAEPAAAFEARRKIIATIERESLERTGLRSDVVTLWKGAAYHLYRYKRYTDVRLVFAPEIDIAFFGGDADNFEFPRYCLDICLFRAYEDGRPARVQHYLKFSPGGPRENELVFVTGHPGRTSRLLTVAELRSLRDFTLPFLLMRLNRAEVLLSTWSARAPENARRAGDLLFGVQNGRKAYNGRLAGLLDPDLFGAKEKAEAEFKARLAASPEHAAALNAYTQISNSVALYTPEQRARTLFLENGYGFQSDLFGIARTLLRAGEERPKPDGTRLHEFSDAAKASLELELFSNMPIYSDLEIVRLTDSLTFLATQLGVSDPLVSRVLAGKSPQERAVQLVNGTKVASVDFRKKLYAGGADAVSAANDPMIELARLIDPEARRLRRLEEERSETREQAHAAISRARNALLGTAGYPDATFTLRLAFGTVKGYLDEGKPVPPFTTVAGLFQRGKEMGQKPPFVVPEKWLDRKSRLNLKTPFNFVSTCDIIGGNSGSPVLNRAGEFVGIIFDGNRYSLPWDYAFNDEQGRAISVDSAVILEALTKVYRTKDLVQELQTGRR